MGRSILSLFLMTAIVGGAFSFPTQSDKYQNIPQCMQPSESGLCLAYFPSWFYNPSTGECESFIYGGCQGNDNRFVSQEACMAQCGNFKLENKEFKLILESDEAQPASEERVENDDRQVENNEEVSVCTLKSETGPCRGMMNRFYFNGDKCEAFIYGGCQGNGNNFKTIEECQQKCAPDTGNDSSSNSEEQTESKVSEEAAASSSEEKE